MARRRTDSDGSSSGTRGQHKDLTGVLRRSEQIGTLHGNQSQVAANSDSRGSALQGISRPNNRTANMRAEAIAYAYRNIARRDGNERTWVQHFRTKPGE